MALINEDIDAELEAVDNDVNLDNDEEEKKGEDVQQKENEQVAVGEDDEEDDDDEAMDNIDALYDDRLDMAQ